MSIGLSQLLQADTTTAGSPVVSITCKKPRGELLVRDVVRSHSFSDQAFVLRGRSDFEARSLF